MSFDVITNNIPYLWEGLKTTLKLAAISIGLSFVLGTLLGMAKLSKRALIRIPATLYVEIVRGTPLIMVIFWVFFLIPILVGHSIQPFTSAVAAFTIFTSAYIAEIVRAGINSIPVGQTEAALASGLTYWQAMRYIILPQAITRMIPPLVGQFISLFKDTSLAYIIGVLELTRRATIINNREFKSFEIFTFTALIYFVLCYAMSRFAKYLEKRRRVGETKNEKIPEPEIMAGDIGAQTTP
ncbi:MAG: amino acid ABC transporter permease [Firmicutes bacterium]|nr:amino acid ABC transporter permease [Bacillota bacterium]